MKIIPVSEYYDIFGEIDSQIESNKVVLKISNLVKRSVKNKPILPGGPVINQGPCSLQYLHLALQPINQQWILKIKIKISHSRF